VVLAAKKIATNNPRHFCSDYILLLQLCQENDTKNHVKTCASIAFPRKNNKHKKYPLQFRVDVRPRRLSRFFVPARLFYGVHISTVHALFFREATRSKLREFTLIAGIPNIRLPPSFNISFHRALGFFFAFVFFIAQLVISMFAPIGSGRNIRFNVGYCVHAYFPFPMPLSRRFWFCGYFPRNKTTPSPVHA